MTEEKIQEDSFIIKDKSHHKCIGNSRCKCKYEYDVSPGRAFTKKEEEEEEKKNATIKFIFNIFQL